MNKEVERLRIINTTLTEWADAALSFTGGDGSFLVFCRETVKAGNILRGDKRFNTPISQLNMMKSMMEGAYVQANIFSSAGVTITKKIMHATPEIEVMIEDALLHHKALIDGDPVYRIVVADFACEVLLKAANSNKISDFSVTATAIRRRIEACHRESTRRIKKRILYRSSSTQQFKFE